MSMSPGRRRLPWTLAGVVAMGAATAIAWSQGNENRERQERIDREALLPRKEGPSDVEVPIAGARGEVRYIVDLGLDGNPYFLARHWPLASAEIPGSNPPATRPTTAAEQDSTRDALRGVLRTLTRDPKLRSPDGSSLVSALVRGPRAAKWKYVEWVMHVCAEPEIKIYTVEFEVVAPK